MPVHPAWIDPNLHTAKCIENVLKIEAAREAYDQKWPNHCKKCHGQGGKDTGYDPSPGGISALSSGSMKDFDTCTNCADKGICPRCGHQHTGDWEYDYNKCEACGWDWGKNPDEIVSDHDQCNCLELKYGELPL